VGFFATCLKRPVGVSLLMLALFLSGAPIEEPLVHYGPFLMNSVDEINEAIEDFNAGKFGYLKD